MNIIEEWKSQWKISIEGKKNKIYKFNLQLLNLT